MSAPARDEGSVPPPPEEETSADRSGRSVIAKDVSDDRSWKVSAPDLGGDPTRLPTLLPGGFRGLGDDLERRSREWANMVRLLEQQRLHLESAEQEREALYDKLSRLVPEVQESGRLLKGAVEACKAGEMSGDLSAQFTRNARALDELERASVTLNVNALWCRSAWEQYARTVVKAQRLRAEMQRGPEAS